MNTSNALIDKSIPDRFYTPSVEPVIKKKTNAQIQREQDQVNRLKDRIKQLQARHEFVSNLMEIANGKPASKTLADALEEKRMEFGLMKHEFAAVIGVSRYFYSDVMAGRRHLYIDAARRAFALGVDAGVLMSNRMTQENRDGN